MEALVKKPLDDYHIVFRKVIRDVTDKLEKKYKMIVSDSFTIIMVKLVALDPQHKFVLKQPLTKVELDRLVAIAVDFVTAMNPIQRNIIRMQLHYKGNHFPRAELINAHILELESQMKDVYDDIVENNPRDRLEVEVFYKKLTLVVIIKADLGQPSDPKVVKETEAALGSVFPLDEVNLLVTMFPKEREREILNIALMTTGVRLFNHYKDPQRYGAGIDDVTKLLPDKIFKCASLLSEMRERSISRLIRYTTLIKPYFLDKNPSKRMGRRDISKDMLTIRQGLVMIHQILMYIKELSDELLLEDETCDAQMATYNDCVSKLSDTVKDHTSIPTLMVYPHFIALAQAWKELQMSLAFMETMIELVKAVYEYSENDLTHVDPLVDNLLGSFKIPDEATFFDFPKEKVHDEEVPLVYRTEFSANMDPLEMKYTGFCVWSLVKGLGLLIMGNPNIGVFHWRDDEYILSSAEAAYEFRGDPETWVYKAVLTCRRWPELIFVLGMEKDVFNANVRPEADGHGRHATAVKAMVSEDSSVQTEMHPMASHIDHSYSWNEWEYRRRAVTLSKLYKCATHSTQTHIMSLRKNEKSQTYPMKNARVQTMKETSAEIPMSQFYLWGLRGCHQHPPHVVELSRDCAVCLSCFVPSKKNIKKKPCLK